VTDVPDPPRFLNVDTIYHDSVMLTWKPPLNDGGGFITQYIVEKLEQGMENWIRCCTTRYIFLRVVGLFGRLPIRIMQLFKKVKIK